MQGLVICFACSEMPCDRELCSCDCHKEDKDVRKET